MRIKERRLKEIEREEEIKKQKEEIDTLKSKHEEIEDCLFGLIEMSDNKYTSNSGNDGSLTYTFKLKGINVISERFSQSTHYKYQSIKHTFNKAQFELTDDLVTIFNSLKSVKVRVEHIFPGILINTVFKKDELQITFYKKTLGRVKPRL